MSLIFCLLLVLIASLMKLFALLSIIRTFFRRKITSTGSTDTLVIFRSCIALDLRSCTPFFSRFMDFCVYIVCGVPTISLNYRLDPNAPAPRYFDERRFEGIEEGDKKAEISQIPNAS